jgi:hypothetical protein
MGVVVIVVEEEEVVVFVTVVVVKVPSLWRVVMFSSTTK